MAVQIDGAAPAGRPGHSRLDWARGDPEPGEGSESVHLPDPAMSSTGTSIRRSSFFFSPVSTMVTGRNSATTERSAANSA